MRWLLVTGWPLEMAKEKASPKVRWRWRGRAKEKA
jgi:hypothetical protein